MALTSTLFAVSLDPATHDRLDTQDKIVAEIARFGGARNVDAHIRLHRYDAASARAWIAALQGEEFSAATIDALSPEEQTLRVVQFWTYFGKVFQCLNLCPYGWSRFRRLCERAWGFPAYGNDGWSGKINTPYMNGRHRGEWRSRIHAITYSPSPAAGQSRGSLSPAYDRGASVSSHFWTGAGNPDFGPTDVVFGDPQSYAVENAGGRSGQAGQLADTGPAPTVEVHRVWMQRTGKLIGGYPRGLDLAFARTATVETSEVGPFAMSEAWRVFNFGEAHTGNPGRFDDWHTGFTLPDAGTVNIRVDMARSSATDVQWTVPPLRWYWELLGGVVDLSRGATDSAKDTVRASLVGYLATLTPEQIIREVFQDVVERNAQLKRAYPLVSWDDLATEADRQDLARQQEATRSLADLNSFIGLGGVALGGILAAAGGGPAGMAIGGLAASAAKLAATVISGTGIEDRRTDIFGRLMPVLEVVSIDDSQDGSRLQVEEAGLPPGVRRPSGPSIADASRDLLLAGASTMDASVFANVQAFGARQTGTLRLVGMPPAGRIEIGQQRRTPPCAWEPGQTVYRCEAPLGGPFFVRVVSPEGEARMAQSGASLASPVSVEWARMFPEHRFAILGLPPGTDVFVDGAPAMGAWADDAMTSWEVFLPAGQRDVRLVPPAGAPVLTTVQTVGPRSETTWAAMVAASAQQRQTAAPSSNAGLWIAGGVTLAAAVLFLATVTMGEKRQSNPKRRR